MSFTSPFTGDVIQPTDVSYASYTIGTDLVLTWPVGSNGISNVAARVMEITATTSGLSVIMPPANQVSVGQDALIRNLGSNTFTIKDNAGGTIIALVGGKAEYIYVTNNSTVAGTWGIIAFGTGTSSADASTLAGLGLMAISTTLNQTHPVESITNGYTFTAGDRAQTAVWASGAGTATLPLASTLGNNWFVLFKNNGTGSYEISTSGSDLFDGASNKTYQPDESSFIVCDGSQFVSIGYGQSNIYSFSANIFPITSGAYTINSSQASSLIQEFVGTLTGNVTVTFPPVVNLYVISNQATNGTFTVKIQTGLGNQYVIPAGATVSVVCDGTNFFNANTVQVGATSLSVIDGSVGVPAINFANETNTGIWRPGAGTLGISILGVNKFRLTANGIECGTF